MDITSLKQVGNLQSNFMFALWIPVITLYNNGSPKTVNGSLFSILSRTAEIPALTKTYKNIRFLNRQIALPFGQTHEGEINFSIVLSEDHKLYDLLVQWFTDIDHKNYLNGLGYNPFVTAWLELRSMDNVRTKIYQINGLSPKHIPALGDLSQESTDGIVTMQTAFAYDSIDYNLANDSVPPFFA